MKELTAKQTKFVAEMAAGKSQRQAYREAYGCVNWKEASIDRKACEMFAKDKIKAKYNELLAKSEEKILDNYSIITKELLELINENKSQKETVMEFIEKAILSYLPDDAIDEKTLKKLKTRRSIGKDNRYAVLERAGFKCQACGAKPEKDNDVVLHIDHIKPFSLGGSNKIENLQVLCRSCNISKGNKSTHNHNS